MTSADPRALPFLVRRVKALPFLGGALERHLEELPDPTSGMSRTERQLLAAIARGESRARARGAGDRSALSDHRRRARRTRSRRSRRSASPTSHAITALGRQALAGAIDRVHEHGIDEWRGGVHLTGHGPVWRWESRERRLIEK